MAALADLFSKNELAEFAPRKVGHQLIWHRLFRHHLSVRRLEHSAIRVDVSLLEHLAAAPIVAAHGFSYMEHQVFDRRNRKRKLSNRACIEQ
jgi:hypothetical protein